MVDNQHFLDNDPIGVVVRLDLARALVLSGDKTRAKAAYEGVFALWKNADPGFLLLKQARAEYAKLQ